MSDNPDDEHDRESRPNRSVVVIIPTYNERENLGSIIDRVRVSVPDAHVLVVDDNSPDGTGTLADELAAGDAHIHVLHRAEKKGLGAAYIAGFRWALDEGFSAVVEMDADGSHQPEQLRFLLAALDRSDLVIGSRWVPGSYVINWPKSRRLLSKSGNAYARLILGTGLHDLTAGYRVYRDTALRRIGLENLQSQGYSFQVDLTVRALRAGLVVIELPITFVQRAIGSSKMNGVIVVEALWRVTQWGVTERWRRLVSRPRVTRPRVTRPRGRGGSG
ncbi:MAG TPA: polyprenol monophosphomannose synthase [Streptosporangiaceae bacterium]|jgi:dolichol-phosphate mannosyltransferase|nr:polyprenol monophosphomannose synthase [Streptosporangiaceae bacterium]